FHLSKERWLSQSKPERHATTTSTSSVYVIVTNPFETHDNLIVKGRIVQGESNESFLTSAQLRGYLSLQTTSLPTILA
ncbi:MAG: hypothetical protein ACPG8W_26275, partial [Candidatus Promineifilaceae bacterium]